MISLLFLTRLRAFTPSSAFCFWPRVQSARTESKPVHGQSRRSTRRKSPTYGQIPPGRQGYAPSRFAEAISKVVTGNPDPDYISTSYIERQNLTLRVMSRRLTRLTNAFSKSLKHLKAAITLHFAYYNFCRVHQMLKQTPCMAAGIADHVWAIEGLLS